MSLHEAIVEDVAVAWFEAIGWQVARGLDIVPASPAAERRDYGEIMLAPTAGARRFSATARPITSWWTT